MCCRFSVPTALRSITSFAASNAMSMVSPKRSIRMPSPRPAASSNRHCSSGSTMHRAMHASIAKHTTLSPVLRASRAAAPPSCCDPTILPHFRCRARRCASNWPPNPSITCRPPLVTAMAMPILHLVHRQPRLARQTSLRRHSAHPLSRLHLMVYPISRQLLMVRPCKPARPTTHPVSRRLIRRHRMP